MRTAARAGAAAALALLLGCGGGGDLERQADEALGAGRPTDALALYQAAAERGADGRVWAKLGALARRLERRGDAVNAFDQLGRADATRRPDAADGLEEVALDAVRAGDVPALRAALRSLAELAPERPVGRLALDLARLDRLQRDEALQLLPAAVAAAGTGAMADSLLAAWGLALREAQGCRAALPVLRAARRRGAPAAGPAVASCAALFGDSALGDAPVASAWYEEALAAEPALRPAWLGLARARAALGDSAGARDALARVLDSETNDSIAAEAADLQRALSPAPDGAPPQVDE